MASLTLEQVINNNEIFTSKQQDTFMNQINKNGRLQSKTKERIRSEYLRFYQEAYWTGRGRMMCMVIGNELNVIQKKVNSNTKEVTKLGALLVVLFSYSSYLSHGKDLSIKMNRAKWMQLSGIKITKNDSFNYKERYSQLLYNVLTNQVGAENKEIINYATGNYEKAREAFDRGIWNSINGFLKKSYEIEHQVVTLYNFNEDAVLNHYAKGLEEFLKQKQQSLKSKNILRTMAINWKKYNNYLDIPQENPTNVTDLILRSERIKQCINKTVYVSNADLGLERIQFDYAKLKVGDYEAYDNNVGTEIFEKKFNSIFKGIEATECDKERIEFELDMYIEQNDFNLSRLFYSPYSEKSIGYKTTEKKVLNSLEYEKRYSLFLIDFNIMEKFIEKPFFIHNDLTYKLSNDENTIQCMIAGKQELIRPLITLAWDEKLLAHAMNNKALPGIFKQKMVHPVINDVLFIIMRMTDNFYENQYLPKNKIMKYQLKATDKERYIREIEVIDKEIKEVLERYQCDNSVNQFELSEEEYYQQQSQIESCYNIINKLIDRYICS